MQPIAAVMKAHAMTGAAPTELVPNLSEVGLAA